MLIDVVNKHEIASYCRQQKLEEASVIPGGNNGESLLMHAVNKQKIPDLAAIDPDNTGESTLIPAGNKREIPIKQPIRWR